MNNQLRSLIQRRFEARRLLRMGGKTPHWRVLEIGCGRAIVSVGDVTAIRADDETYDAVFDFGIIHHVPDWRAALREIRRVLKPGGRLFAEEVHERFISHPAFP
ncbi:MAG: class I SAM-dependent methyltransferase [Deltaproteobacteria bacterium]|nr:class I SAM-dependent methyltransferase [Deltaproteobacteria bacterium]